MDLTPAQWEKVKTLFEGALEKTPAERSSYIEGNEVDPQVRTEVERLLAHHVESGGFLSQRGFPLPSALSGQEPTQAFASGDVVASRFRILRFLARGGMGEVYEAEDLELHEHVALKSVRGELLHDEKSLERFKREVHLARQVTHPNVCRIYELFWHSRSHQGPLGKDVVVFVAMEMLEGETLAEFLKHDSCLSAADALPIALQMAAGLGAAHAAGIVHRDFKPGNVHLVPRAQGMRVVITDFGLALRSSHDLASVSVTGTGEVLGTPAYMSPEQVEGKELTPASDIYSLGLVLYQMVTGARPFQGSTPLSVAVSRLREDPTPPHKLVPGVDRRLESLILKCLHREPQARFQSGDQVAEALRGELPHRRNAMSGVMLGALALILVILAGTFLIPRMRHQPPPSDTANLARPISIRRSVAVLPLRNLSGWADKQWVSTALPEMLTAELAAGGRLRTIPGENVTRASADLKLTGMQTLARDTLGLLRNYLGSDYVVMGSYLDQGGKAAAQIRIDLWLQDTQTGEIAATVSEKGSESDLDNLATRAGTDLREKLGVGEMTPAEAAGVRASLPTNPEAQRLYSEGVAKLRVADAVAARPLLEAAVAADRNFALGHSSLADAWASLGYDQKAQEESKKALDLSSGLSREERLWIEGKDWELNRKWDKAIDIYRSLFEFFPDNIEYGLRLANAQERARTTDEALATIAALRKLPAPGRDNPNIDLAQAAIYDAKGAYREEQAAAEAAASRARMLGATQLQALALVREASSFEKQGKLEDALRCAQESAGISGAAGDRAEVAAALSLTGIVYFDQGNFTEAAKAYNDALETQRETGNVHGTATTLNDLANVLGQQGDLAGAIKMLNEALLMFRQVGDKTSVAAVLGNIAVRTIQQGDLKEGRKLIEEGLATSREIGDQERTSTFLYNLGEVLRWQGDLNDARKMYQRSEGVAQQIGDQSGVAYALFSLGDVSTAEGDLSAAREKYNASIALRTKIGEKGNVAEAQMALALLSIEDGHGDEVANMLTQAREEFRKEGLGDDEILADTMLARILLSQGKVADAEKESAAAHKLLAQSQDFSVGLRAAIGAAEVQAAAGKSGDAMRMLEETTASSRKFGYVGYQLEAQLALGEVETASGKVAAGLSALKDVQSQAQLKGFRLIARNAALAGAKPATAQAK
jgi:serine/threonine protein kinase/tetratricopeptide (TPR) repeat protein